jgi:hypothetical protein
LGGQQIAEFVEDDEVQEGQMISKPALQGRGVGLPPVTGFDESYKGDWPGRLEFVIGY